MVIGDPWGRARSCIYPTRSGRFRQERLLCGVPRMHVIYAYNGRHTEYGKMTGAFPAAMAYLGKPR